MAHETQWRLPQQIVSRADIARLLRELEAVEDSLHQAAIRRPGTSTPLPSSSRLLEELARDNRLNLLQADDRQRIGLFLKWLKESAPVTHISFAVDPSAQFTGKLILWLRREIHPYLLLQLGLQPSIAAGCVVRTANKHFDFSLRERLRLSRALLMQKVKGVQ